MAANRDVSAAPLKFPDYYDVLSLKDLVEKYSSSMPFQFRVVKGFLSAKNNKDPTFGHSEVYAAHLLVETEVVRITSADGEFRVPTNSLAKFGLIHDEQVECMNFNDVDELLFAKPCPKVVAVRNDCTFPEVALKKNEVLIIKEVVRATVGKQRIALKFFSLQQDRELILYKEQAVPFTTNPRRTQLSLTDLIEHIGWDCMPCLARVFSEGASSTLQSLLTSTTVNLVHKDLNQSIIVSRYQKCAKSKVGCKFDFISVPPHLDVTVSVTTPEISSEPYKEMVEQTLDLLRHYSPSRIQFCFNSDSNESYSIQEQLFSSVRTEREKESLTKFAPAFVCGLMGKEKKVSLAESIVVEVPSLKENEFCLSLPAMGTRLLSSDPSNKSMRSSNEEDSDDAYVIPPFLPKKTAASSKETNSMAILYQGLSTNSATPEGRKSEHAVRSTRSTVKGKKLPIPPKLEPEPDYDEIEDLAVTGSGILSGGIPANSALRFTHSTNTRKKHNVPNPNNSQEATHACQPYVHFLPKTSSLDFTTDSEVRLHAMVKQIEDLQKKVADLSVSLNEMIVWKREISCDMANLKISQVKSVRHRKVITRDMSPEEVATVLVAIGLPQYKDAFLKEVIDGITFMGLDDITLEKELQISSKIHRLRILKLTENN